MSHRKSILSRCFPRLSSEKPVLYSREEQDRAFWRFMWRFMWPLPFAFMTWGSAANLAKGIASTSDPMSLTVRGIAGLAITLPLDALWYWTVPRRLVRRLNERRRLRHYSADADTHLG